jgi:hypothetical protein
MALAARGHLVFTAWCRLRDPRETTHPDPNALFLGTERSPEPRRPATLYIHYAASERPLAVRVRPADAAT